LAPVDVVAILDRYISPAERDAFAEIMRTSATSGRKVRREARKKKRRRRRKKKKKEAW
jgi:hypothetical protein